MEVNASGLSFVRPFLSPPHMASRKPLQFLALSAYYVFISHIHPRRSIPLGHTFSRVLTSTRPTPKSDVL